MDIVIFLPDLRTGGVERIMLNLAKSLNANGEAVSIVVATRRGDFQNQVDDGINVVDLNIPRTPVGILGAVPYFATYIRKKQPDVIISSKPHANITAICSNILSGKKSKTIVTEHDIKSDVLSYFGTKKTRITFFLASHIYNYSDQIVAVSESVKEDLVDTFNLNSEDVIVIHNPVITDDFHEKRNQATKFPYFNSDEYEVILTVARLDPRKNIPGLINAVSMLEWDKKLKLVIFGEGRERERLEKVIEEDNLEDLVDLPGYTENPYPYMREASVFVLPSLSEGLPTVLIEALGCGCPIVATECSSGPPEILGNGEYGELVPTKNDQELANSILKILSNPPDSEKLQKRSEDFSSDEISREYMKLIKSI
ncbi:glycosyltransferase [Natrialbaceae archaeon A-CW1-1]